MKVASVKIIDILDEKVFSGDGLICIVQESTARLTKNDKKYLTGNLIDNTGTIKFNVWGVTDELEEMFTNGSPVILTKASIDSYEGVKQLKVVAASPASASLAAGAGVIPASPYQADDLDKMFNRVIDQIEADGNSSGLSCIREVVNEMEITGGLEKFKTAPAAQKIHQAYLRGLYEHSIQVARIAHRIMTAYENAPYYKYLDSSVLLTGALFHDIGKIREYSLSPLGLSEGTTLEGGMSGHIIMGTEYITDLFRGKIKDITLEKLRHIILSHHGKKEWGSPVEPAIIEAVIVHQADMVDSQVCNYAVESNDMWVKNFGRPPVLNIKHSGD